MNLGPAGPKGVVVIVKITAGLLALTLSLAACAADGDESNTATDEVDSEVATQEESSDNDADGDDSAAGESAADDSTAGGSADEPAAEDAAGSEDQAGSDDEAMEDGDDSTAAGTEADSDDSTDTSEGAGTDSQSPGLLLTALLAQAGLEPTDEILSCVEDRGVDVDISTTADEQAVQEATLVLFTCAPDELAEILAAETPPPDGTTVDDVECVIAETFRYLGSLPTEEAIAALEQSEMPQEVRDDVLPVIEDNCGLTNEQASAIFES